jgi:hypothetical protein
VVGAGVGLLTGGKIMKLVANLIALLVMLSPTILLADDFSIEEENLRPLPMAIDTAIRSDKTFADYKDCELTGRFIDISGKEKSGFAATIKYSCGMMGAYNGPIWLIDMTANPLKVVLFEIGAGFEVGKKSHNGLRDIQTGGGSAGTCNTTLWKYESGRYVRGKAKSCV